MFVKLGTLICKCEGGMHDRICYTERRIKIIVS